ncbi:MAG: GGDEF domain-containing protein [Deltaproteobacteria bacterium CG2_30_63_29]|nr:MAG: GGDEF domain-containing protein [Deltaproteobacteria bacterium CG2_30_63_29]PJB48518.1 MAG: GGDEF domain-containing protein [Deltaproteobacteria bacterium CG_4_9_14_3_um_filter_63_12]
MGDELEKDATVVTVISKIPTSQPTGGDACMVVIAGADLGKKYPLSRSSTLIGRSPKTDIMLDGDSISRNHAMIVNEGARIIVRDLGSTNGTYVNDVPIKEIELRDADQVKIGRTIFKFLSGNNVENAYHEEIYRLTTIDGMTQVFNKRYFMEEIEREMSRSLRYGRNMALVMLDLDHFKLVNDTYGHLAGDFVLKQVAQHINRNIRRDDSLARYGGEEFALICPETDKPHAVQLTEKLRAQIEEQTFTFDGVRIPVTVSAGIADLEEYIHRSEHDPTTGDVRIFDFIKLSDDRLYAAKRLGRNVAVGD